MSTEDGLEFLLLGPVEAWNGAASLPLGGRLQRALLADLALNVGRVVSSTQLIDDLWGESAPPSADHTLETYVSRLRRVLRNDSDTQLLVTRPPGYVLDLQSDRVDVQRFAQLVATADAAATRNEHTDAAALLTEALALWRGDPLSDIADVPYVAGAGQRLEAQRLVALEKRIEADLQLGRHRDLIPELEALTDTYPYREALHGQLILALYRCGRQADSLAAFQKARRLLRDELGIEPSADLKRLEQSVLNQDAAISAPRPNAPPASADASPTAGPASRRRWIVAGIVATVAAGIAVAVPLATTTDPTHVTAPADGIAVLAASGRSLSAGFALPTSPTQVAYGAGSAWVTSSVANYVYRIDPSTGDIKDRISVGAGPEGIAYVDSDVWVANVLDGTVSRISPATDRAVQTIGVGSSPTDIAPGYGRLWVTDPVADQVDAIDPSSGRVTKTLDVPLSPAGIAVGAGSLWVTNPANGSVSQVDPTSGKVKQRITVGAEPDAVTFAFDAVWVANQSDSTVTRIDSSLGSVDQTITVGEGPDGFAIAGSGVWVTDGIAGIVQRLDPDDGHVISTATVGNRPTAAVPVAGKLWVTVAPAPPLQAHRGGDVRVLSQTAFQVDPAFALPDVAPQLFTDMFDELVTSAHTNGSAGLQLVPDLAVALPTPTDNGRTYTFTLRRGIRYSNGAVVKASDFEYGFERMFRLNAYNRTLVPHLIGAKTCTLAHCDLSAGVQTDDRAATVTLHLDEPDAHFLEDLQVLLAPMPRSVPMSALGSTPVPTTGPYMVKRFVPGQEIDLVRNPMFHEWSAAAQPAGYADEIDWVFGLSPAQEAKEIEAGRADWTADQLPDIAKVEAQYPALVHIVPVTGIAFASFNVRTAPFNDIRVRRAVSYAADRSAAVRALGGPDLATPACQILPPGLPGYRRYCPFTVDPSDSGRWVGPDLAKARDLIAQSGTRGMRVTLWTDPLDRPLGNYVVSLLRKLGYRSRLRLSTVAGAPNLNDSRSHAQVGAAEWIDTRPATFFEQFLSCSSFVLKRPADTDTMNFYCRPKVDRLARRADRLETTDPAAAAALWTRVDRLVTNDVPWLPLASLKSADIVSARCRHYLVSPRGGILLDQLWLR